MKIKFGPAGLGGVKEAAGNLQEFNKSGLSACEIAFTYGVYIKNKDDAKRIGEEAKKQKIKLSIHAPYWINLNSKEKKKIQQSKDRILKCCEIGDLLGAYRIVFHPGYYGGMESEETYQNIKKEILDMKKTIKKKKLKPELAPETTGKVNVFGSIEEISRLVKDTRCSFCLDFAHILAREKKVEWKKIKKLFPQKQWHCHFSGIDYGEKGERRHKNTSRENWKNLFKNLPKNKEITIISESPSPVKDSIAGLNFLKQNA